MTRKNPISTFNFHFCKPDKQNLGYPENGYSFRILYLYIIEVTLHRRTNSIYFFILIKILFYVYTQIENGFKGLSHHIFLKLVILLFVNQLFCRRLFYRASDQKTKKKALHFRISIKRLSLNKQLNRKYTSPDFTSGHHYVDRMKKLLTLDTQFFYEDNRQSYDLNSSMQMGGP